MPIKKVFVNNPPTLPPRYCRYCGERIQAVYPTEPERPADSNQMYVAKDEQGRWIMRYTGEAYYKRSEFFCTQTHAELFADRMVRMIDAGAILTRPDKTWTAIALGKGKPA